MTGMATIALVLDVMTYRSPEQYFCLLQPIHLRPGWHRKPLHDSLCPVSNQEYHTVFQIRTPHTPAYDTHRKERDWPLLTLFHDPIFQIQPYRDNQCSPPS